MLSEKEMGQIFEKCGIESHACEYHKFLGRYEFKQAVHAIAEKLEEGSYSGIVRHRFRALSFPTTYTSIELPDAGHIETDGQRVTITLTDPE